MAKHVDYYVSLNSPWTYLGSKRFEAMAQKHGADVTIWPVDFGSVFAVSGGLPLPKRAPQRQAYRMMELKRWRDHLGVKTTLEPKFFPANEVPAAKCVIALREQGRMADAIKVAHAVLAALWAEEKNTGDPATLQAIIAGCGLDAAAVIKASELSPKSARPTPSRRSSVACSARPPS
jgi:carboxymethylenebutenolidase